MNILDNEIKSLSLDTIKLSDIFNKYNNININLIQQNYKKNKLFKKFITLSIRLNLKLFTIINEKYKLKNHDELLNYTKKLRKVLLKKYAINILKYLLEDRINIISHIESEFDKLKKYFLYIDMYEYLLKNIFINTKQLEDLCFINTEIPNNLDIINSNITNSNITNTNNLTINTKRIGKLECISTNSTEISFDSNIQLNMSSYINYKSENSINGSVNSSICGSLNSNITESNYLTQSKGKVINISLKNYIAEYSN
jgi:hypothetical protein